MTTWDETKSNGSTYTPEEYNALIAFAKGVSESATLVVAASDSLDSEHADYVCDGIADDVEINQAIAALPATGGRVLLLDGTYDITTQIDLDQYTTIEGQGQSTVLKASSSISAALHIFDINATSRIEISKLFLDGNDTSGHGQAVTGVFVHNDSDHVYIHHCWFMRMTDSVSEDGYGANEYFWIDHCVIDDISDDGIDFNYSNNGMISNCIITNCGDNGIDTERSLGVVIANNRIQNCGGHGIEWESETYYASSVGVISNNVITDISGNGIHCDSGQRAAITGNSLSNIDGHGVYIGRVSTIGTEDQRYGGWNTIVGNVFDDIGGDGVYELYDGVNKTKPNLVASNYFKSITGTAVNLSDADSIAYGNIGADPYNYPLSALSNVTEDSPADGELLAYVTDHWENRTPAEAGLFESENLASISDVNTGTSTTKAVTPDALAGSNLGTKDVQIAVTAPDGDVETGDGQAYFVVPPTLNGMILVDADASVLTASTSGTPTVQIRNVTDSVDMLSTAITIDANEKTSYTATTAPAINTANDDIATGDQIAIDVDVAGTGTKGLNVVLSFRLP